MKLKLLFDQTAAQDGFVLTAAAASPPTRGI
jgi:hypothetical protein